jgi:hypothetical protein
MKRVIIINENGIPKITISGLWTRKEFDIAYRMALKQLNVHNASLMKADMAKKQEEKNAGTSNK